MSDRPMIERIEDAIPVMKARGDTEAVSILQAELERHRREYYETLTAEVSALLRKWLDADARGDTAEMERLTAEHIELNKRRWECERGRPYADHETVVEEAKIRDKARRKERTA